MRWFIPEKIRRSLRGGIFGCCLAVAAFGALPAAARADSDDHSVDDIAVREFERAVIGANEQALRVAEYIRLGEELLQARQYQAAGEQFMMALSIDPESAVAKRGRQEALRYLAISSGAESSAVERLVTQAQVRDEYNLIEITQYLARANDAFTRATSESSAATPEQKALVLDEQLRLLDEVETLATRAAIRMEGVPADGQVINWKNEVAQLRQAVKQSRENFSGELAELRRAQAEKQIAAEKRQVGKIVAEKRASMFASARDYVSKMDFEPALAIANELLLDNPGDNEVRALLVEVRAAQNARRAVVIDDLRRDRRVSMLQKLDQDAIANVTAGNPVRYPADWDALVAKKKVQQRAIGAEFTAEKQATLRKLEEQYSGFEFTEAPFAEVVLDNIRTRTGLNINAAGIPEPMAEKEINLTPHNMRLSNIFKHILRQVNTADENDLNNLTYVISDQGIVNFVTKESLKRDLVIQTRVFDIQDIVTASKHAKRLSAKDLDVYAEEVEDEEDKLAIDDLIRQALPDDFGSDVNPGGLEYDAAVKKIIAKGNYEQIGRLNELLSRIRGIQTLQVSVSAHYLKVQDDFWEQFKSEFYNFDNFANRGGGAQPGGFDGRVAGIGSEGIGLIGGNGFLNPAIGNGNPGYSNNYFSNVQGSMYNGDISGFTNVFNNGAAQGADARGLQMGMEQTGILGALQMQWFLQMIRQNERNDELFAPHLIVFNNRYGWIRYFTRIPYLKEWEDSSSGGSSVMRPKFEVLDDGCSLEVEPTVSPDRKYVSVRLIPRITKLVKIISSTTAVQRMNMPTEGQNNPSTMFNYALEFPVVSQFETGTYATLPDGGSVILSGLSTNIDGSGKQGTPVLMDLPIIGNAFSNRFYQKNKETYTCLVGAKIIVLDDEEAARGSVAR